MWKSFQHCWVHHVRQTRASSFYGAGDCQEHGQLFSWRHIAHQRQPIWEFFLSLPVLWWQFQQDSLFVAVLIPNWPWRDFYSSHDGLQSQISLIHPSGNVQDILRQHAHKVEGWIPKRIQKTVLKKCRKPRNCRPAARPQKQDTESSC